MRVVAVVNQKGGVGKTTTVCNLGAALGRRGFRVLLVDLDPQAHLSLHFGVTPGADAATLYDVLVEGVAAEKAILPTSATGVSVLPAHLDLSSAELELAGEIGRETILRAALADLRDAERFDAIFLDCPPSLGLLSLNGLTCAEEVLVPLQAEFFALQGIGHLQQVMDVLKRRLRRGPRLGGIVLCRFSSATRLAREVLGEVQGHFQDKVFSTVIRQNIRLAEASSHGVSIFDYDPNSAGAADYAALAEELLARWSVQVRGPRVRAS